MVSNRKNIFITLLLFILAGAGIKLAPEFKKLGIFGQAQEKIVDSADAQTNTTQNLKLGAFLKSPGALYVPPQQDPLAVATSLSSACHEIAIKVHSLDLRDEIPVNLFPSNLMFDNCMDDFLSLQKLKQDFMNSCLKLSDAVLATEHDFSPNSLRNECHSALFMLRAVFTKIAVGNTDIKNINDPKILMQTQ